MSGATSAGASAGASSGAVSICLLYPELLGTYGDGGNAVVLARRLRWRGFDADIVEVAAGTPTPTGCDIYLMGGGEDGPQTLAVAELNASRALHVAVDRGAAVLAVCAGFQLLGTSFHGGDGRPATGLGLLDAVTTRGAGARRVGEIVVEPTGELGLPPLTGYENHQGVTALGDDTRPLGRVVVGKGNDAGDRGRGRGVRRDRGRGRVRVGTEDGVGVGVEGAIAGRVVGTYLHGPVLARNPALADLVLSWVVGPLTDVDDREVHALRAERMAAARARRR